MNLWSLSIYCSLRKWNIWWLRLRLDFFNDVYDVSFLYFLRVKLMVLEKSTLTVASVIWTWSTLKIISLLQKLSEEYCITAICEKKREREREKWELFFSVLAESAKFREFVYVKYRLINGDTAKIILTRLHLSKESGLNNCFLHHIIYLWAH